MKHVFHFCILIGSDRKRASLTSLKQITHMSLHMHASAQIPMLVCMLDVLKNCRDTHIHTQWENDHMI